jgi:transcriptional regulator with XRE-family HTH domain
MNEITSASVGTSLRDARRRAGLTQRELARLAGTTQSSLARIESGDANPTWDTVQRLARAAGFTARLQLEPVANEDLGHLLDDIDRIRALTPADRLRELKNISEFFSKARRV